MAALDGPPLTERVNRVLRLFLFCFILIALRLWFLTVSAHDDHLERTRAPQNRQVVLKADRGTIRDRFNIPLAVNTVQYNAAVLYSEIREIPSVTWETQPDGTKVRRLKRREYIKKLSKLLGDTLEMSPERIEDLIHARAALFHQVPYVIARNIPEKTYYQLRMLQKDWRGIQAERAPRRVYPRGRVASDVVGYLGAINRSEWDSILMEMKVLRQYVLDSELGHLVDPPEGIDSPADARQRLRDLEDRAYVMSDQVGKAGIEAQFEEELRGFRGRTAYYSDAQGNFLRELPGGHPPLPGQRVLLTISAELQEYAEQLLIQQEQIRDGSSRVWDRQSGTYGNLKEPWIKGGAIVAMDPKTGEVLALASYPRFDPNDFIPTGDETIDRERRTHVQRWFEGESYLGGVWNGQRPLLRERYNLSSGFYEEELLLDWDSYLNLLLPEDSPQRQILAERNTIRDALQTGADEPLLVDLYRLAVDERKFTPALEKAVGPWKLATHRRHAQLFVHMNQTVKEMVRELFRDLDFTQWREKFGQEYLKEKRRQEKLAGRYARPYLDYYARMENHLFEAFWEINRWPLITSFLLGESSRPAPADIAPYVQHLSSYHRELSSGAHAGEAWTTDYKVLTGDLKRLHPAIAVEYLRTLRSFEDLDRPLLGTYPNVRSEGGQQFEKHLATAFYPVYGFGCMRPHAYRQAAVPGSVFKIVTAYAGLTQEWERLGADVSTVPLFEIMDGVGRLPDGKGWMVGTTLSGQPIPQVYRGGRLIRTLTKNVGRVDLQRALEVSSNPYFSLLAGDLLTDPEQLNEAAHLLGYGQQTGIALPGELAGRLPTDLRTNKSGLYAAAIGQHTLVVTPLQTAVMLSTVANGGQVLVPKLVRLTAGKLPVRRAGQLMQKERFLYQRSLNLIGVHFPLFTGVEGVEGVHQVYPVQTTEVRDVPMPPAVRRPILQGMQRMVQNARTAGWPALVKIYSSQPDALRALQEMKGTFVAKSSTAEALEAVDVDTERGAHIYNHVWAGAIAFSPSEADNQKSMMVFTDPYGDPELVVVVYLRFGGYGKHALPVAAQIVEKWREIRARQ